MPIDIEAMRADPAYKALSPQQQELAMKAALAEQPPSGTRLLTETPVGRAATAAGLSGGAVLGAGALAGAAGLGAAGTAAVEAAAGLGANRALEQVGLQEPSLVGDVMAVGGPLIGRGLSEGLRGVLARTRGGRALRGHAGATEAQFLPEQVFLPNVQRRDQLFAVLNRIPTTVPTDHIQATVAGFSPQYRNYLSRVLRQADDLNEGLEQGFQAMTQGQPVRVGLYQKIRSVLGKIHASEASPTGGIRKESLRRLSGVLDDQLDMAQAAGAPGIPLLRQANEAARRVFATEELHEVMKAATTPVSRSLVRLRFGGTGGVLGRLQHLGITFDPGGVTTDPTASSLARSLKAIPGAQDRFVEGMRELERLTVRGDLFITPDLASTAGAGAIGALGGSAVGGPVVGAISAATTAMIPQQIAEIMVSDRMRPLFLRYLRLSGGKVSPSILASLTGGAATLASSHLAPTSTEAGSGEQAIQLGPESQERLRSQGSGR